MKKENIRALLRAIRNATMGDFSPLSMRKMMKVYHVNKTFSRAIVELNLVDRRWNHELKKYEYKWIEFDDGVSILTDVVFDNMRLIHREYKQRPRYIKAYTGEDLRSVTKKLVETANAIKKCAEIGLNGEDLRDPAVVEGEKMGSYSCDYTLPPMPDEPCREIPNRIDEFTITRDELESYNKKEHKRELNQVLLMWFLCFLIGLVVFMWYLYR